MDAVGGIETVIVLETILEQPPPFVTVTVKVVFEPGETVIDCVVAPLLQK